MALALFAALVAPEALCTDRRTGMLDLYLAGPARRDALPRGQVGGGRERDAGDDGRPAALHLRRLRRRERRPLGPRDAAPAAADPVAGIGVALFYTAVAMGVSSLTTRRAVAAVATVLVLLVPAIAVGVAIDEQRCSATSSPSLDARGARPSSRGASSATRARTPTATLRSAHVSTGLVVAALLAGSSLGAGVCLASYRRQVEAAMSVEPRQARRWSRSAACRSGSAASSPSPTSASTSVPGSPRCSARTAPASRRCSGCSAAWRRPSKGTVRHARQRSPHQHRASRGSSASCRSRRPCSSR